MTDRDSQADPRDPHCRYPKCECPPSHCQRLNAPFRIDTDSDFTIDIGRDKAALIELGRRHPAAADDVDAILAMPRSDAVNKGLHGAVAQYTRDLRRNSSGGDCSEQELEWMKSVANYLDELLKRHPLRAVPSPDTVGVREALAKALELKITDSTGREVAEDSLHELRKAVRAALSPSHCTAGGREEEIVARIKEACAQVADRHVGAAQRKRTSARRKDYYSASALDEIIAEERGEDIAAEMIAKAIRALIPDPILALISEQSGPTAGSQNKPSSQFPLTFAPI